MHCLNKKMFAELNEHIDALSALQINKDAINRHHHCNPDEEQMKIVAEISSMFDLPVELKYFFMHYETCENEICCGDLNFYKLNHIKTLAEKYNVYQNEFIDIGDIYYGMGEFIVLALHCQSGKYFFRFDGGSNPYERVDHFKCNIINFGKPEGMNFDSQKSFTLLDVLSMCKLPDLKLDHALIH